MTRHVPPERLSEWVSGELNERDTATVRTHVGGCGACAAIVADFRAQGMALRGLDRPEPPPTLWPIIEGAIEARETAWSWPAWLWGALAGATVAGIVAWAVATGLPGGHEMAGTVGPAVKGPSAPATVAGAIGHDQDQGQGQGQGQGKEGADPLLAEAERELDRAATSYAQAASRLRTILEHEQARWDAASRARVAERLAGLDEAIVHARASAKRDPGDGAGAELLFSAYRRQIDFLAEVVHRGSPGAPGRTDRGFGEALP